MQDAKEYTLSFNAAIVSSLLKRNFFLIGLAMNVENLLRVNDIIVGECRRPN
jgi:hypothetical protein